MSEFYEDKTLNCRDCKQPFVFTGGEQRFYAERQFTEPNRCKPCRAAKKAAREAQGGPNNAPIQGQGFNPPPAQLDSGAPRRPFVYDPTQDRQQPQGDGAAAGKKRSGGGKRRRDEEAGWGGGYDD